MPLPYFHQVLMKIWSFNFFPSFLPFSILFYLGLATRYKENLWDQIKPHETLDLFGNRHLPPNSQTEYRSLDRTLYFIYK